MHGLQIPIQSLLRLKDFGEVTIAVASPIEADFLVGKFRALRFKIVLLSRVPIIRYDVLISNSFSELTTLLAKNLKIKYLLFTTAAGNFNLDNYYEFEENSFRITSNPVKQNIARSIARQASAQTNIPGNIQLEESQVDQSKYKALVKDIAPTEVKYGKSQINYLHPVVPGRVSIIMVITGKESKKYADVLRELRAQEDASVEFIIVDNNCDYKNNVKPDIRYKDTMPEDFCIYHAKELSSGEYIIVLNQDSESFNIMTAINQGKYETR